MSSIQKIHLLLFSFAIISCSSKKEDTQETKEDFCASIHSTDTTKLSTELRPYDSLMQAKTGVYVLEDGGGSLITRAWLSEKAEKSIDIQYFIFSTDNVGLIACDYLVRAADRGVKVRLLIDDIMVDAEIEDILTLDSHKNIEIKVYNPGVNLGKNLFSKLKKYSTDFKSANQRMHNKTFTIDGKVCVTGGRNIADEYFDYDHEYNFRDRDILLMGKITQNIQDSFDEFWASPLSVEVTKLIKTDNKNTIESKNPFEKLHQYACNPENFWPQVRDKINNFNGTFNKIVNSEQFVWSDSVQFVTDLPGKNKESGMGGGGASTSALIKLIQEAKKSIEIQSPYLITTQLGQNLLQNAVKRGVKVRILTNSMASTDNMEAFSGYQRDRLKLLKTGVRIFEFKPDAAERYKVMTGALQKKLDFKPIFGLHAKSIVIDDQIAVIGTFNLDPRSANLNTECVTIVRSKQIANGVLKGMEIEFKPENSWEVTPNFNPDSEASLHKQIKTLSRRIVPKNIL